MPTDPQLDTFSLLLVAGAVYTVVLLARRGRSFWTDALHGHPDDRQLAIQVAFFLLTPPAVLMHELAHAATTWALGGEVLEIHYAGFSGWVRPSGFFSLGEVWAIAVSGTVASVAVALVYLLVGAYARPVPVTARYALVMGGGLQAAFSLAGYPLWSILGRFGDWMAIYDFDATPGLSALTVGAHALTVVGRAAWWRHSVTPRLADWERGGPAPRIVAGQGADPDDPVRTAFALLQQGDYAGAEALANDCVSDHSHDPRPFFVLGIVRLRAGRYGKAAESFERAIALTDDEGFRQGALVNLMLAYTYDHRAKEALAVYERLDADGRQNPGVQQALDVIQVRTGKRPPPPAV